ncbi:MAG: DUF1761 domain-containing protein [Bacteroidia bacterium]|nr:DUF1761 domain-containing protein [Bacteroidia bacterium]
MEEVLSHIKPLAAVVGGIIPFVVGFIWYNPKVFGITWMQAIGKTEEDLSKGNMILIYGLSFVSCIILAFFLQVTVEIAHWHPGENGGPATHSHHTFGHGAFHGLFLGIGFALPVVLVLGLFAQFNWKYIAINISYWLVCFTLIGGLVDAWI